MYYVWGSDCMNKAEMTLLDISHKDPWSEVSLLQKSTEAVGFGKEDTGVRVDARRGF